MDYQSYQHQPGTPVNVPKDDEPSQPQVTVRDLNRDGKMSYAGGKVTSLGPLSSQDTPLPEGDIFLTAKNPVFGNPVTRENLKPTDVLKVGDMWDTVKAWHDAGILTHGKDGYSLAEKKEATPEAKRPEVQMEKLSDKAESTFSDVTAALGQGTAMALIGATTEGKDEVVSRILNDGASRMGLEPAELHGRIENVKQEMVSQARRATGFDEESFAGFSEWAWENHPNEVRNAIERQTLYGDLSAVKALGQQYAASGDDYGDAELAEAVAGEGIEVFSRDGKLLVRTPSGISTLRAAIRAGEVTVSKK